MSRDLPEGWAAISLSDVIRGFDAGRNLRSYGRPANAGEYGVLKISAVTWGFFRTEENKALLPGDAPRPHEQIQKHDLLISRANTSDLVGAVVLVARDHPHLMLPDKILRLRVIDGAIERCFLVYALRSREVREHFAHNATGTSDSMRNLSQPKMEAAPIRLAPLAEQRRIVEKVEALLEQVNRTKARLDRVHLILKRFRQAVLAAACSGELTREWRGEHSEWVDEARAFVEQLTKGSQRAAPPADVDLEIPEGWRLVSLDSATSHLTSGSRAWKPFYRDDGFGTFVMAQNVRPMKFDRTFRQGVAPPQDDPERIRTTISKGDILVTIVGANTGDVCRVDDVVRDHFVCQSVALARPRIESYSEFMEIWLNSPRHGQGLYQEWAYGEGRPHLSFDHLRSTPLAVPGQAEQAEIVSAVRRLFALAYTIERRVNAGTSRAEKLPQAILSKAFSGELVPTEAELARIEGRTFESAEELLERVRDEAGRAPPADARGRRGTKEAPHSRAKQRARAPSAPTK